MADVLVNLGLKKSHGVYFFVFFLYLLLQNDLHLFCVQMGMAGWLPGNIFSVLCCKYFSYGPISERETKLSSVITYGN